MQYFDRNRDETNDDDHVETTNDEEQGSFVLEIMLWGVQRAECPHSRKALYVLGGGGGFSVTIAATGIKRNQVEGRVVLATVLLLLFLLHQRVCSG